MLDNLHIGYDSYPYDDPILNRNADEMYALEIRKLFFDYECFSSLFNDESRYEQVLRLILKIYELFKISVGTYGIYGDWVFIFVLLCSYCEINGIEYFNDVQHYGKQLLLEVYNTKTLVKQFKIDLQKLSIKNEIDFNDFQIYYYNIQDNWDFSNDMIDFFNMVPHFKHKQTLEINQELWLEQHTLPYSIWTFHEIWQVNDHTCDYIEMPWLKSLHTFHYTKVELDSILMYTYHFDEYINRPLRYMSTDLKDIEYRLEMYKKNCIKSRPVDIYSNICSQKNTSIDEFRKTFDPCLERFIGSQFYNKTTEQQWKLIFELAKQNAMILINLSKKLTKRVPRTRNIVVYRGIRIDPNEGMSDKNFPRRLYGFTSCTYSLPIALRFANVDILEQMEASFVLAIIITPDINMFTTDVITQIPSGEQEVVLTDKLRVEYYPERFYIEYLKLFDNNINIERKGHFYKAIPVLTCKVFKI